MNSFNSGLRPDPSADTCSQQTSRERFSFESSLFKPTPSVSSVVDVAVLVLVLKSLPIKCAIQDSRQLGNRVFSAR